MTMNNHGTTLRFHQYMSHGAFYCRQKNMSKSGLYIIKAISDTIVFDINNIFHLYGEGGGINCLFVQL